MRAALGMVGLLIVLGIGYLIYSSQIHQVTNDKPLVRQTGLISVRGDLIALAQSEKMYFAANGRYATLEQLKHSNMMNSFPDGSRSGYRYSVEVDDAEHFQITASPSDPNGSDLPTLSVDETLQISQ
jgi:hypothetical protein